MSEYYYELLIKPNSKYEIFLDLINSISAEAIEEDDNFFILRSEDDLSLVEQGILEFSKAIDIPCFTKLMKKNSIDWIKEYQKNVKAIEIGNFFIRPSWENKKENKIDIVIDPALSFGSGHHETTASCIEAIDKYVEKKDLVLDVGCGSGILSIATAKKNAIVDICDTDKTCIKDTKANFILNEVTLNEAWLGSCGQTQKKYDVVIANIVADVLIMISKDLKKCMKSNGILIISGILDKYTNKVVDKFKDLKQVEFIQKNEWVTIIFKKEF